MLSHPNNPTGGVYAPAAARALAGLVAGRDMLAVVDQLYCRLIFDGADYVHLAAQPGMAERTVTLAGPSKTESMSGYRVGAAVGPAPVIDAMERVLSLAALRTAGYGQQVLRHWMADDAAWLADRTAAHQALRDELVGACGPSPASPWRRRRQLVCVPGRVRHRRPATAATTTPSRSRSRRPGCWSAPATSSARPGAAGSASTSPRTPAAWPWPATASRPCCAAEPGRTAVGPRPG